MGATPAGEDRALALGADTPAAVGEVGLGAVTPGAGFEAGGGAAGCSKREANADTELPTLGAGLV